MVAKQINQSDLQNLENKIKLDISKEQQELRHWDRSKMQQYINYVDDLRTDQALTNQTLVNMDDNFKELKQLMKEWFQSMNNKIDWLDDKFATTDHVERVELRVDTIEKEKKSIMVETLKYIAMALGGMIVAFVTYKLWLK